MVMSERIKSTGNYCQTWKYRQRAYWTMLSCIWYCFCKLTVFCCSCCSYYMGHSLCFAIWFFNNTYNDSVYSSFSKKHLSACTHLTVLSNQLSVTPDHVDWGMSKMMPSKNTQASSAFWNCFPFSCFLTEGNKNQSQGAKSGEYGGWVTSWTSLAARKSRATAAVCTLALSWWRSRSRTPIRGGRLHHAWKTLGRQWLTYRSAITVFLSSSSMVATQLNFAKKHAIICLETLLFLLNFTGGFSSGKTHTADCCFVLGLYWYTQVSSPVTMSQTWGDLPPSNCLCCGCTSPPYLLLLFTQVMGYQMGTTFLFTNAVVKNVSEASWWNLHDIL